MPALCPVGERREGDAAAPGGTRPGLGAILRAFLASAAGDTRPADPHARGVLWRLARCGTGELGEALYECRHCGHRHWTPRSCGDRHCPGCLAGKSRAWLARQQASLLPVTYYHWVFTLPAELHPLLRANQARLYKLLFDSVAGTLLAFGRGRLGGELGLTAVLHTWGQKLDYHPHLHGIVTGGALSQDGRRWRVPKQRRYLFPLKAVGAGYRGRFLAGLRALLEAGELTLPAPWLAEPRARARWLASLYAKSWVVYGKRPFGGPEQVLGYLANYTHRVALSNRRLVAFDPQQQTVTFTYRDYRDGSQIKLLTLDTAEFVRRFCLHILPPGFVRIRHYGLLGNNRRKEAIAAARALLMKKRGRAVPAKLPAADAPRCPQCGRSGVRLVGFTDWRGTYHHLARKEPPRYDDTS